VTKRLSFLLLDANIIIELWRLGLWNRLVELCDIHVGQTDGRMDLDDVEGQKMPQGDEVRGLLGALDAGQAGFSDAQLQRLSGQ
jgi:hypothetical protein